jgi:RecB family exonuclease
MASIKTFSHSAISSFQSCPKSFQFKYIQKLPEAFTSIELHMGRQVHEALRWGYEQKGKGIAPDIQQALEVYRQKFYQSQTNRIRVIKDGLTQDDYFYQGKELLENFYHRRLLPDTSETLALEKSFTISLGNDFSYRGVIDRLARLESGVIRVIDFKTGRAGRPLENLQLPSYALYVFDQLDAAAIELCIEDLKEERTIAEALEKKEAAGVREDLLKGIDEICRTQEFLPQPSILCQWCGYQNVCPQPHESVSLLSLDLTAENPAAAESDVSCPECGSPLKERSGKYGPFLGCSNYPNCRYTLNIDPETKKPVTTKKAEGKDICPECGSLLKERSGKFGPFIGCTNYPNCRFTRPVE